MSEAAIVLERAKHYAQQGFMSPLACLVEAERVVQGTAHAQALLLVDQLAREQGTRNLVAWIHDEPRTLLQTLELFDEAIFRATLEG